MPPLSVWLASMALATALPGLSPRSVYTPLSGRACTTVEANADEAWSVQRCPGTAGYALLVSEGDLRQSVDVVAPGGQAFPLDLTALVSSAFSSVGPRAEWRVEGTGRRARPVALIVRFDANEDTERPERRTSRLVVARVSATGACVTDVVQPARDMNARARRAADRAASRPCLSPP